MKLQPIETDIKNDGYKAFYLRGQLLVTRLIRNEANGEMYNDVNYCLVYIENNKYVVEDNADGNIPTIETFSAKSDAIAYIRDKFPL
jgi:hypothetical protein